MDTPGLFSLLEDVEAIDTCAIRFNRLVKFVCRFLLDFWHTTGFDAVLTVFVVDICGWWRFRFLKKKVSRFVVQYNGENKWHKPLHSNSETISVQNVQCSIVIETSIRVVPLGLPIL